MIATDDKVTALERERDGIHEKLERLREATSKKENELHRDLYRLNAAIQREKALSWVGQQVRYRFVLHTSHPQRWMNDATGTLIAVRRKRGTVDFGAHGKWSLPLDEIQHADDTAERGIML